MGTAGFYNLPFLRGIDSLKTLSTLRTCYRALCLGSAAWLANDSYSWLSYCFEAGVSPRVTSTCYYFGTIFAFGIVLVC